jgi:hypothetical protein
LSGGAPSVAYDVDVNRGVARAYNVDFPDQEVELPPAILESILVANRTARMDGMIDITAATEAVRRALYGEYALRYMN